MLVGRAVASVAALLDLQLAVVAGSVALGYGATFFDAAQREIDERCGLDFTRPTRIVPGRPRSGPVRFSVPRPVGRRLLAGAASMTAGSPEDGWIRRAAAVSRRVDARVVAAVLARPDLWWTALTARASVRRPRLVATVPMAAGARGRSLAVPHGHRLRRPRGPSRRQPMPSTTSSGVGR